MRLLTATSTIFLALAAPVAAQHGVAPTGPSKPALGARLAACTTGIEPTARAATFTASMPSMKGARRMAIRFELQQRLPGAAFVAVEVPGWVGWQRSEAGRSGFIYTRRVQDLLAPATYRAAVRLRWYARGGKLLREVKRVTPECEQPDPRPDLVLGRLGARPAADPAELVYELVVENRGGSAAAMFGVALNAGAGAQTAAGAGPLAAGSRELVSVTAPRCEPGSGVSVTIDVDGAVAESDEANAFTWPCPV